MIMIGIAPFEDTYINIRDTEEFVINIPGAELLKKIWVMAQ
jgi:flavin reductase (DIM6/NTAB) family NADH-FMN oxidoreductase RutF